MADDAHERPTVKPTLPTAPTRPEPEDVAAARATDGEQTAKDRYLGTTIGGRYKILEKLGEGGMGVVYIAEHVLIEKKVAIKVLSGDFAKKRDLVARFAREAKAASRIGHENIINITDFGETPSGSAFFAMELLDGRDLARHIRRDGALPIRRVVRIVGQVCRALSAAHAKGIVHRDLKPDNIFLVEREGRGDFVKILDFGLAKVSVVQEGAKLTHTGMIFGTAEYMSPEQARGEPADHRSDVYATGCILYELLTGDVPFRATSFMMLLRKHIEQPPEPPSRRRQGAITPALDSVVLKALAKERDARFQTMQELALALCAATDEDPKVVWGGQDDDLPRTVVPDSRPVVAELSVERTPGDSRPAESRPGDSELVPARVSRRPLIWLGAAAVAVTIAVAAMAGRSGSARREPTPSVAAAAPVEPAPIRPAPQAPSASVAPAQAPGAAGPTSRVTIVSTPPDADVVNGVERLGRTPLELALPRTAAAFEVTVEHKGYREHKLRIEPAGDHEYVVRLLAAPKPAHSAPPVAAPPTPPPQIEPSQKTPRELKPVE